MLIHCIKMDICDNTLLVKIRGTSFKAGLQTLHAFVAVLIFFGDNYPSFSRPLFKTHFNTIDQCLAAAHPTHQLPLPPAPHTQTHKLKH